MPTEATSVAFLIKISRIQPGTVRYLSEACQSLNVMMGGLDPDKNLHFPICLWIRLRRIANNNHLPLW